MLFSAITSLIGWSVLAYLALYISKQNFPKFCIPYSILAYYCCVALVGHIPLILKIYDYRTFQGVISLDRIFFMLQLSGFSLFGLCLGASTASVLFSQKNHLIPTEKNPKLSSNLTKLQLLIIIFITLICTIITFDYLYRVPKIALLGLIQGHSDPALLRSEMTKFFSGPVPYHYYATAFSTIIPFCAAIAFANALKNRGVGHWLLAIVLILYSGLLNILDLQKAPLIWLIFSLLLVYILSRSAKANWIASGISIFAMVSFSLVMYSVFMGVGTRTLDELANALIERVTVGALIPAYFYIEVFPEAMDYLGGATFPSPRGLFPWEPFPFTSYMHEYLNIGRSIAGLGTAPAPFWGEIYINFGMFGVILITPIIGLGLGVLQLILNNIKLAPVKIATVAWCATHFIKLAESGIGRFLLDTELAAVLSVSGILLYVHNSDKKKHLKNQPTV